MKTLPGTYIAWDEPPRTYPALSPYRHVNFHTYRTCRSRRALAFVWRHRRGEICTCGGGATQDSWGLETEIRNRFRCLIPPSLRAQRFHRQVKWKLWDGSTLQLHIPGHEAKTPGAGAPRVSPDKALIYEIFLPCPGEGAPLRAYSCLLLMDTRVEIIV